MELREQRPHLTLAQKLGDATHVSPLLRKVRELSGCTEDEVGEMAAQVRGGARSDALSHATSHPDSTTRRLFVNQ